MTLMKNTQVNIKKNIPRPGMILSSFMAVILTGLIYPMTKKQRKESLSMGLSADTALNGFGKIECGLSQKLFTFVTIFKWEAIMYKKNYNSDCCLYGGALIVFIIIFLYFGVYADDFTGLKNGDFWEKSVIRRDRVVIKDKNFKTKGYLEP